MLKFTFIHGIAFQTPSVPCDEYCPIDNSVKNSGIPAINNIKKYGIKNTPPPF